MGKIFKPKTRFYIAITPENLRRDKIKSYLKRRYHFKKFLNKKINTNHIDTDKISLLSRVKYWFKKIITKILESQQPFSNGYDNLKF